MRRTTVVVASQGVTKGREEESGLYQGSFRVFRAEEPYITFRGGRKGSSSGQNDAARSCETTAFRRFGAAKQVLLKSFCLHQAHFSHFYLRRSRQVLEGWQLLLLLLWGDQFARAQHNLLPLLRICGFINSLQGGIHHS